MILIWLIGIIVLLFCLVVFFGAPYVPSHRREVRRAFTKLRPLSDNDVVVDLGSGDGVVLRQAVLLGAGRAVGYELNPLLVAIAWVLSWRLRSKIQLHTTNMWQVTPPSDLTVVYLFGVGRDMSRIVRLLQGWATSLDRPLHCIVYGHELPGVKVVRQEAAHRLYKFTPLH